MLFPQIMSSLYANYDTEVELDLFRKFVSENLREKNKSGGEIQAKLEQMDYTLDKWGLGEKEHIKASKLYRLGLAVIGDGIADILELHYPIPIREDDISSGESYVAIISYFLQFGEVEQIWLGDLAWTIRLLKPLLLIVDPEASVELLTEITSEDELKNCLETQNLGSLKPEEVLSIIRNSEDFFSLGQKLFEKFNLFRKRASD